MSTSHSRTDESDSRASLSSAQYSAYDWYGETDETDDEDGDADADILGNDPNGNAVTQMKIESLAHLWLKQTSEEPLLDPVALCEPPENGMHDREGIAVDLTDPEVYPPTAESLATPRSLMEKKAPSSRRWRYSEDYGHLTYGGIIRNRPKDKLLELVEYVAANISAVEVPPRNQRTIREGAKTLKEDGGKYDVQIMRRVAEWIFLPNQLFEDAKRGFKRY
ncbi:hypothetical protein [Halomontanus rarus]|uniref:hypothetical protein n=1 Tax=Halomontanus rarus TaxID=3034020 RepID=UPI00307C54C6